MSDYFLPPTDGINVFLAGIDPVVLGLFFVLCVSPGSFLSAVPFAMFEHFKIFQCANFQKLSGRKGMTGLLSTPKIIKSFVNTIFGFFFCHDIC